MADTIAETVEILYSIDQEKLTVDQQIALAQAYASLAQAEKLELMRQLLHNVHQLLNGWLVRSADGGIR